MEAHQRGCVACGGEKKMEPKKKECHHADGRPNKGIQCYSVNGQCETVFRNKQNLRNPPFKAIGSLLCQRQVDC